MNWTGGKTKRKFNSKHSQSKNKLFFANSNSSNHVQPEHPIIELKQQFLPTSYNNLNCYSEHSNHKTPNTSVNCAYEPSMDIVMIQNAHKSYKNFSPNSTTSSLYYDDVSETANVVQLISEEINDGNLTETSSSTYCNFTVPKKSIGEATKTTVQNDFTGYESMKEQVVQLKRKVIWLETMVLKMNDALQLLTKRN